MLYFTIHELTASPTAARLGIDNTPTAEVVANLEALVNGCLDKARRIYGSPVFVTSGYRCEALNKAVKGASNSQHTKGEAADLTTGTPSGNARLAKIVAKYCEFDQVIFEDSNADETECQWVHVSHKASGNRRQVLTKRKGSRCYVEVGRGVSGYKA